MSRRPEPPDREGRRHLLIVGAAWLVLTAVGELLVELLAAGALPVVASDEGRVIDDAIVVLLFVVVPVFTFVVVVVVYSMLRFRVPDDDAVEAVVQRRSDGRFSWSWLGVTSALTVLVIVYPGITGLREIWRGDDPQAALRVNVTAEQWEWRFGYPRQGLSGQRELVLPVGRTVRFVLRSRDVIHSFWVPAFRIKEDVVPGETRQLYLTPDRIVSTATSPLARVQCAELCGIGHTEMRASVRVVSPAAFAAWAKRQRRLQTAAG